MNRYRPIQTGHVFARSGAWYLQYRTDERADDGTISRRKRTVYLCACRLEDGREITKREAERIAYEQHLTKENAAAPRPATLATVEEFWRQRFEPEHVATLKKAGRRHYGYCRTKVIAALGAVALRDVEHGHVQALITEAIQQGLSTQTAHHLKNAVSGLFRYAQVCGFHHGQNPASLVRIPPMRRKRKAPLTFAEAAALVDALDSPARELAALSMLTSMNMAEMAALRLEFVNLTAAPRLCSEGPLPPFSAMVRANYYDGEFDTTKTQHRRRIVPLPPGLVAMLAAFLDAREQARAEQRAKGKPTSPADTPEALLFQNRAGRPIDQKNLLNRHLKPIAEKAIGRTDVSWHLFRHCAATWADLVKMPLAERVALMGHASEAMTMHYTHEDIERRRPYLAEIETLIRAALDPAPKPQPPRHPAGLEEGLENYESATVQ